MTEIDASTALITGASAGIGETYAHHLAERGVDLILTARRKDRLQKIATAIREKHPVDVQIIAADLTLEKDLQLLESQIKEDESISILINNAGFGVSGEYTRQPVDKHLEMIDVHIVASVRLTHAALPSMLERKHGYIVNVSSIAAFISAQGSPGYSASKAYLNSFSTNLNSLVSRSGVRVQALCPGYTLTEFHTNPAYRGNERETLPSWVWMTSDKVVKYSLKKLDSGKVIVIPGFKNKLISHILRSSMGEFIMGFRARFLKPSKKVAGR